MNGYSHKLKGGEGATRFHASRRGAVHVRYSFAVAGWRSVEVGGRSSRSLTPGVQPLGPRLSLRCGLRCQRSGTVDKGVRKGNGVADLYRYLIRCLLDPSRRGGMGMEAKGHRGAIPKRPSLLRS